MQIISNKKIYKKISKKYLLIMGLNIITMNSSLGMQQFEMRSNEPTHNRSRSNSLVHHDEFIAQPQAIIMQQQNGNPYYANQTRTRNSSQMRQQPEYTSEQIDNPDFSHPNNFNNTFPDSMNNSPNHPAPYKLPLQRFNPQQQYQMQQNMPEDNAEMKPIHHHARTHSNASAQQQNMQYTQPQAISSHASPMHHARTNSGASAQQLMGGKQHNIQYKTTSQTISPYATGLDKITKIAEIPPQAIQRMIIGNNALNQHQRMLMPIITQGASILTKITCDPLAAGTSDQVSEQYQQEKFLSLLSIAQYANALGPAGWARSMRFWFLTYSDFVGKVGKTIDTSALNNFPKKINDQFEALAKHIVFSLTYFGNAARTDFSSDQPPTFNIISLEKFFEYIKGTNIEMKEVMNQLRTIFSGLQKTDQEQSLNYFGIDQGIIIHFDNAQSSAQIKNNQSNEEKSYQLASNLSHLTSNNTENADVNTLNILITLAIIKYDQQQHQTLDEKNQDELTCWEETMKPWVKFWSQSCGKITQQIGLFTGLNILRSLLLISVAISVFVIIYAATSDFETGTLKHIANQTSGEQGILAIWKKS